ncbi:hypothetical protein ASD11_00990 [Aeromicrobium sp. Root495]|uniref:pirin family protein n=1 Tax=Aeromicrobium sp. Root495 TaxID=1736550 RepID=UPI000700561E|nr:pirin family protein [Aeromicrobium sp. Root495]KQY58275.1 hypothetical protein ASD11_00990 [Aeromicrobium sp. Root495]
MRDLRPAGERFVTRRDGIETWHSFSHGDHYDADNTSFGAVIAINEERIPVSHGYAPHHHEDVEIVTWVLEGTLSHEDTTGQGGHVRPGAAQRLSAGSGVEHSENNAHPEEPLRFVQMMLRSTNDGEPEYAVDVVPDTPGLHLSVPVHAPADLLVARPIDTLLTIPEAERVLIHVTHGIVVVDGESLTVGDELRLTHEPSARLGGGGEALVWLLR